MRRTLLLCLTMLAAGACRPARASTTAALAPAPAGAVRHVVIFKFKPGATAEQIGQLTEAFAALEHQIPGVLAFEHGVNNSPEHRNEGFTHVYVFTFVNAAARDAYLEHPAHKAFGALVGKLGIWDGSFVVDYTP